MKFWKRSSQTKDEYDDEAGEFLWFATILWLALMGGASLIYLILKELAVI